MASEKAYRIVLAGDAAVGKSSFLLRLCKNEFKMNCSSTLGELERRPDLGLGLGGRDTKGRLCRRNR